MGGDRPHRKTESMGQLATMLGASGSDTFLGVPAGALDQLGESGTDPDIVVLGAPCATPYPSVGPYSKSAPGAIRASSATYATTANHHNFDLGGPIVPAGISVVDAGDIGWDPVDASGNRARITAACQVVLNAGATPVVLGGDDSIPIPVIAAYLGRGPMTVVQIDAHIDWRDEVQGERMGLSSTMRRSSEMEHVGRIIQVGRRGVGSARSADARAAADYGVHFVNGHDVHRFGIAPIVEAIEPGSQVFLTIDVDGFDPTTMPGVVGPEPGGLTYWHGIELIDGIASHSTLVGFDIVEFVPELDVNGIGALTAFRLTAHAIGRIGRQRPSNVVG